MVQRPPTGAQQQQQPDKIDMSLQIVNALVNQAQAQPPSGRPLYQRPPGSQQTQQQSGGDVNNFNLNFGGGGETRPPNGYSSEDLAQSSNEVIIHMSAGYSNENQAYGGTESGMTAQSEFTYQDQTQTEQTVFMEQNTYVENNYVDNSTGSTTYVYDSTENNYVGDSTENTTNVTQNQYQDNSTTNVDSEYVDSSNYVQQDQYQDNSTTIGNTNNYVDERQYGEQSQYVDNSADYIDQSSYADQSQWVDQNQYVEQSQYVYQTTQYGDEGDIWMDTDVQQEGFVEEQQTACEDGSGNGAWGDSIGYDGEGYGEWDE